MVDQRRGAETPIPQPVSPGFSTLVELLSSSRLRDTEGRPLGEDTLPRELRQGVPMQYKECPYPGSRKGRPMNASALGPIRHHWPAALGVLAFLRQAFVQHYGPPTSALDLYRLGQTGTVLPCFLHLRADGSLADGEIPPFIAAAFKSLLGFVRAAVALLMEELKAGHPWSTSLSADVVEEFINQRGLFLTPRGVCAAPMPMVRQMLDLLIDGKVSPAVESGPVQALVSDTASFLEFGEKARELSLLYFFFLVRMRRIILRLSTDLRAIEHAEPGLCWRLLGLDRKPEQSGEDLAWSLAALPREACRQQLDRMLAWVQPDRRSTFAAVLDEDLLAAPTESDRAAATPEQAEHGEKILLQLLEEVCHRKMAHGADVQLRIRPHLLAYLRLERVFLRQLAPYEADLYRLLGHAAPARTVSGLDITRRYGSPTFRDLMGELLGLEIQSSPEGWSVRLAGDSV